MKIRPVGEDLFHADEETDGQIWQSYSRFSQFREPPKKE